MKKLKYLLLVAVTALTMTGCSKITAGHVGIKVNLLGGDKGVQAEEVGVGRYWVGVNEELYSFPTFSQNYVWTASETEGSENDESISFQTIEGLAVNADVGITYRIDPTKVSKIFEKYRRGVDEITDVYLRNMVRDALVEKASIMGIENVYGAGKAELMNDVEKSVSDNVADIGIIIEKIYWIGEMRLPKQIVQNINDKIAATQKAQQRKNEVAQSKAEADKKIEEARGTAESIKLKAKAESEAITLRGEALRSNPEVLQLEAVNKWNGVTPVYIGTNAPLPFLSVDNK
ncbi:SPFH domain-containing protein [Vibrio parahaemolyticus]|uniref:SPFH domain-containing protein n=5 Tax=Vibrio parahaemolyticus TaxID=670 RepID=UPI0003A18D2B|nr:SPFH domain-containing protein [Vibrio parahaemolyticus]MBE4801889.1 prohibitin family protein [Vibrio parahaemolyticus]MCZ6297529.1 SPFH domain-containing protein [Vibrio parahaemolyticus]MDF4269031.1 SPFH domain-containing protein [Vibrio parahaemolyticus]MDF4274309.1 SPFH domain-containing protein [Vibrio parahaemolyticus]MDF4298960.1 SPFH domain-containing protein [Vibrio parahaemolyticus]